MRAGRRRRCLVGLAYFALAVRLIARAVGAKQSNDELKRRLGLIESGSSGCARMDFFVLFPSLSAKRR